jgi:Eukaryotic protein of unknown function (DUF829)
MTNISWFARLLFPNAAIRRLAAASGPTASHRAQPRPPLVLLLGWGGARISNLKRLESFYQSRQVPVISFIMPLGVPEAVRQHYVDQLIEAINAHVSGQVGPADDTIKSKHNSSTSTCTSTCEENKIYVHSYSNNGTWTYASLLQRRHQLRNSTIEKLVIDSAPFFYYEELGIWEESRLLTRVMTSVLLQRPIYYHSVISPMLTCLIAVGLVVTNALEKGASLTLGKLELKPDLIKLNRYMRDDSPKIPALFIYSTGDAIVENGPSYISRFKDGWVSRGIPVQERIFGDDVKHTASFFKYPDEYSKEIDRFFELTAKTTAEAETVTTEDN